MLSQAEDVCHCVCEARWIFWYSHHCKRVCFEGSYNRCLEYQGGKWDSNYARPILEDVGRKFSNSATYVLLTIPRFVRLSGVES